MKSVSIAEARTRLSELIDELAFDDEVVITRHGQAVARLVPAPRTKLSVHNITEPVPLARDTMPADLDLPDESDPARP
jgi:prevent-host-death family protein